VTDFSLGTEFPVILGAGFRHFQNRPRLEINVEYRDKVTVQLETQLLVNWPQPCIASLPICLNLSLVLFKGTVSIYFGWY
jgi:maintenance of morphology protein 1